MAIVFPMYGILKSIINFRNRILSDRKSVDMCVNCTEGLKVNIFDIEQ